MFWPFTRPRARAASSGRFGPYTIVRTIHEGEKAFVHLARSDETGDSVVIKVYKPNFDRTARRIRKKYGLRREGSVGLLVNPPKGVDPATYPVVRTIHCGRENGRPDGALFIIMEYINGPSLKSLIVTDDPALPEARLNICIQAAGGLEIVHSKGFVHRDVCSDNFLLEERRRTKLIDLGFCTPIGLQFEEKTGTLSYMAPEQIRVGPIVPQTDMYGLGAVMFELFTGRLPFTSEIRPSNEQAFRRRASEIMQKHVHEEPPPPSRFAPDLDARVEAVILKCLEKQASRRYDSMRDLIRELTAIEEAP